MSQRKSILQNDQAAPGSPLRRSSRIANSPAPPPVAAPVAPVSRRRSSATAVEATAPAKLLKSKRLSLSQDNPVEAPSTPKKGARVTRGASKSPTTQNEKPATPAKRGRRSSVAKVEEENQRVASPAVGPLATRRRSVRGQSTSPSKDKPEPAKTRGRRTSITEKVGNLESIEENDASKKKPAPKTRRSLATRRTSLDVPEEMEAIKSVSEPDEKMEVIEEPKKPDLNPIIEIAEESDENVHEKSSSSLNSEDKITFKLAVSGDMSARVPLISPLSESPEKDSSVPSTEKCSPVKFTDSPPNLIETPALNKTTQDTSEKTGVDEDLEVVDSPVKSKEIDPKITPLQANVDLDVNVKFDKKTNEDDIEAMDISQDDKPINEDEVQVQESPTKSIEERRFEEMQLSSTKSKDSSEIQDEQDSLETSKDVPKSAEDKIVDESKDKSKLENNEFVNESSAESKEISLLEDSKIVEGSTTTSETDLEDFNLVTDSPDKLNDKQKSVDSPTIKEVSPTKSIDQVDDAQKASTSKVESEDMNVTDVSKQNLEVAETAVLSPKEVTTLKEDVNVSPIDVTKTADKASKDILDISVETKTDTNTSLTINQNTPNKTPKKVLAMKQMEDNSLNSEKLITPSKESPNDSASKRENGEESVVAKKTPKSDVKKIEEMDQTKSAEKSKLSKSISEEGNSLNTSNKKTPKKRNDDCLIVNEFEMVSSSDGSFHLNFSLPMSDVSADKKDVLNSTSGSNNSDKENIQSPEKVTVKTPSKVLSELKDVKNQSTPVSKLSELTKPVDDDVEMSLGNKSSDLIVSNVMVAKETDPEQDLIKVLNEFEPETLNKYEKILNKSLNDTAKTQQNQSEAEVDDDSADNKQIKKVDESSIASPKEREIDQAAAETSEHNKTVETEMDFTSEQEIDKNVSTPNVDENINMSKEENVNLEDNDQENEKNVEENKSKEEPATVESDELESSISSSKTSSEESKETSDDTEGECNKKLNASQSESVEKFHEQEIADDDINVSKIMEKSRTSLIVNDSDNEETINVDEVIKSKRQSLHNIMDEEESAVTEPVEAETSPESETVKSSESSDVDIEMPEKEISAEVENEPKITSSTPDTAECSDSKESEVMQVKSKRRSSKKQENIEESMVESTEHLSVSKLGKKTDANNLSDENLEENVNISHSSSKRKSNKRKSKNKSKKEEAVFSAEEDEIETAKQVKSKKEKKNKSSKQKKTIMSDSDECSEYDQVASDLDSNEDDENICNLHVTSDSDDNYYNKHDNFLDDMASEGEEDTPSEGSNDLPEYGESLHSSESDKNDSDEDYEVDSFIDDNESVELLSGNEYDLSDVDKKDKKKSKKKRSRILSISDSDNENVSEKPKSTEEVVDIPETKNVRRKSKSPVKALNRIEILSNITVCKSDEAESSDENVNVEEEKEESEGVVSDENNEIEESEKICDSFSKDKPRRRSKKRTSISLQENLKVSELTDETINEKISKAVDFFCSSIKDSSGNVSLNVSLDFANNSSDDESNPSPPKKNKMSIGSTSKPKVENKAEVSLNESKSEKKLKRKSLAIESEIPDVNIDKLHSAKSSPIKNKRRSTEKIRNDIEKIVDEEPISANEAPPKKKKKTKKDVNDMPVLEHIPTQHIEYLPESLITEIAKNPTVSLREKSPLNKNKTLKKKKIRIAPTTVIGSDDWDIESMTRIKPSKSSIKPSVKMQLQKQEEDLPVNDFRNRKIIKSSHREDFNKILKTKKNKLR